MCNDIMHYSFINSFSSRANTYWFFVPICAPFLGAVVGVLMYQLMIGCHLERDAQEKQKRKKKEEEEEERLKLSDITTNEDAWALQSFVTQSRRRRSHPRPTTVSSARQGNPIAFHAPL